MNLNKMINLGAPTQDYDAANKAYVDLLTGGAFTVLRSAKVATTVAGTLSTSFADGQVIDGVTLVTGDRILIKDQVNQVQNGVYIVNASGAPTRTADFATGQSSTGLFMFITQGTVNSDNGFVVITDAPNDIIGTHNIIFTQFSGAGQIITGLGLSKSGNELSVNSSLSHVTGLGTLTGLTVSGILSSTNTTQASDLSTAAFKTAGGTSISKTLLVGEGMTIGVTPLSGERTGIISNTDSDASSFVSLRVRNNNGDALLFLNSSNRVADGGVNTLTLRNAVGSVRIQAAGATGMDIAATTGVVSINSNATSTNNSTGALTLVGGIGVSNTTDAVSSTNGGTFTTAGGMAIAKKLFVGTDLSVSGTSTLAAANAMNITASGTLGVTGVSTLGVVNSGNTGITGTLSVSGTSTLAAANVTNITASGTLGVTGVSTLGVVNSGNTGITGTLSVSGTSTLAAANATNITASGTLGVTGVSTLSVVNSGNTGITGTLSVSGTSTLAAANATNITASGTLGVTGVSTLGVVNSGNTDITGTLSVSGNTTVSTVSSSNTTATTSSTTGSLRLAGGIGISNTTNASSVTNGGTFTTAGGAAISRRLYIGENINIGETPLDGDRVAFIVNRSSASNASAQLRFGNDNIGQDTFFKFNSTTNTSDGGVQAFTIRNNPGPIRLQTNGAGGATITLGWDGNTRFSRNIDSTSSTSASVLFAGGISIERATDATSSINGGTFTTAGGAAIAKKLFVGTDLSIGGNLTVTGTVNIPHSGLTGLTSGDDHTQYALLAGRSSNQTLSGSSSSGGNLVLRSTTNVTKGSVVLDETTASTSNSTGALTLAGGIAISNTTDAVSSTNGGTLTTAGGAAIAKKLFVGNNTSINGELDMNSNKIINVSTPAASTDAANKSYVDMAIQGLSPKQAVIAATTTDLPLVSGFENGDVIDGVTLVTGNRVLIKNQTNQVENGIYTVNVSGAPTRASDFSTGTSQSGSYVFVIAGTANADSGFVMVSDPPNDVVGTNNLVFTQFSGAGQITAGTGLTKTGNELSVNASLTHVTQIGTLSGLTVSGGSTLAGITASGIINSSNTTASTSNSTGALTLAGGIGISNTSDATSVTNGGTITTAGGAAIAKKLIVGETITSSGDYVFAGTNNLIRTDSIDGADNRRLVLTAGGADVSANRGAKIMMHGNEHPSVPGRLSLVATSTGVIDFYTGSLVVRGSLSSAGVWNILTPTATTSSSTGAMVFTGGIGISNTTDATSETNGGTFTTAGGAAIAKKLFVGETITSTGDYVFAGSGVIRSNTVDGADNQLVVITGGGADFGADRGAKVMLHGSEHPLFPGRLSIVSTSTGDIDFYTGNLVRRGSISPSGIWDITTTTASTSNSTGALTLAGGISTSNTTDATSATNGGTFTTAGGAAIAKKLFVGTDASITGTLGVTGTSTLGVVNSGNTSITGTLGVTGTSTLGVVNSGNIGITGTLTVSGTSTLAGMTATTGSFTDIGVGIASPTRALHVYGSAPTLRLQHNSGTGPVNAGTIDLIQDNQTGARLTYNGFADEFYINMLVTGTPTGLPFTINNKSPYTGFVGIGVTNPTAELDVAGVIRSTQGITTTTGAFSGIINVTNTTASTSNTTGALILAGGIGISNTTDATSTTNGGTFTTAGGAAIAKKLFVGDNITTNGWVNVQNTSWATNGNDIFINANVSSIHLRPSNGSDNNSLVVNTTGFNYRNSSGTDVVTISTSGVLNVSSGIASTNNTTGSIITNGGIGISNTTDATSSTNGGSFTTSGGAAIAKQLIVGGVLTMGANINMNSNKVTNLGTPTAASDAVTKSYVDLAVQGLSAKEAVRVATVSPGTLASSFEDGDIVDGVTIATNDRILIKDQADPIENGIYIVNASGAPTRALDFASGSNESGSFVFVTSGTTNGDNGFVVVTDPPNDVVGTNGLTFTQFSGAGQITAGTGLTKTGNTLSVNAAQTQITSVGTLSGLAVSGGSTLSTISSSNTTASTSNSTGSVTLAGGIGISNTTDATSVTNGGTLTTAGGAAIAKKLFVGDRTEVSSTLRVTGSSVPSSGSGLELSSGGSTSNIYAYNRTGSSYLDLNINDAIYIKPGLVGVGTTNPLVSLHTTNDLLFGSAGVGKYLGGNMYWNGSSWVRPSSGANGFVFRIGESSDPYGDGMQLLVAGPSDSISAPLNVLPSGQTTFNNTTATTSSTTGALRLAGGLAISNTTDSTSATNGGSFTTAGGAAIAKGLRVGGSFRVQNGLWSTNGDDVFISANTLAVHLRPTHGTSSRSLVVTQSQLEYKDTTSANVFTINSSTGNIVSTSTTASTSNSAGALTLAGGIGISNTTDATSSTNGGTFTTAGGAAIAKKLFVGSNTTIGNTSYNSGLLNVYGNGTTRLLPATNGSQIGISLYKNNDGSVSVANDIWKLAVNSGVFEISNNTDTLLEAYNNTVVIGGFNKSRAYNTLSFGGVTSDNSTGATSIFTMISERLYNNSENVFEDPSITGSSGVSDKSELLLYKGRETDDRVRVVAPRFVVDTYNATSTYSADTNDITMGSSNTLKRTLEIDSDQAVKMISLQKTSLIRVNPCSGDIYSQLTTSISNNQASAANVTNLVFNPSNTRSFVAYVTVEVVATTSYYSLYTLQGVYNGTTWYFTSSYIGDNPSITFTITSGGQVQYTTPNYSGFTSATVKCRATTMDI
jgi:hypothetical protein